MDDETQKWQERSGLFSPLFPMLLTSKPLPSLVWAGETVPIWSLIHLLSQHSSFSTQKPNDLNIFARSLHSSVESFLPISHWKNENGLLPQSQKGPLWASLPLLLPYSHYVPITWLLSVLWTYQALALAIPSTWKTYSWPLRRAICFQISPPQHKLYWPTCSKIAPTTPLAFSNSSYFYCLYIIYICLRVCCTFVNSLICCPHLLPPISIPMRIIFY